mmetsp:Transcript_60931/g.176283  ORF Transcript_60931/g.176283 Transcript_60931/m.176283 type:complete len:299 (-) Transcript_60931:503-1399(-)
MAMSPPKAPRPGRPTPVRFRPGQSPPHARRSARAPPATRGATWRRSRATTPNTRPPEQSWKTRLVPAWRPCRAAPVRKGTPTASPMAAHLCRRGAPPPPRRANPLQPTPWPGAPPPTAQLCPAPRARLWRQRNTHAPRQRRQGTHLRHGAARQRAVCRATGQAHGHMVRPRGPRTRTSQAAQGPAPSTTAARPSGMHQRQPSYPPSWSSHTGTMPTERLRRGANRRRPAAPPPTPAARAVAAKALTRSRAATRKPSPTTTPSTARRPRRRATPQQRRKRARSGRRPRRNGAHCLRVRR